MEIKRLETDSECTVFNQSLYSSGGCSETSCFTTHTHTGKGSLNLHDVQQTPSRGENRILAATISSSAGVAAVWKRVTTWIDQYGFGMHTKVCSLLRTNTQTRRSVEFVC